MTRTEMLERQRGDLVRLVRELNEGNDFEAALLTQHAIIAVDAVNDRMHELGLEDMSFPYAGEAR